MKKIFAAIIFLFFIFININCFASTYYIKNGGDDAKSGLDDANAWATLDKIRTAVSAGDTVYLKRGSTWTNTTTASYGSIHIEDKDNITVDAYGSGALPIIDNTTQSGTDLGANPNQPNYNCIEINGASEGNSINNLELRSAKNVFSIFVMSSDSGVNTLSNLTIGGVGRDGDYQGQILIRSRVDVLGCNFSSFDAFNDYIFGYHIYYKYGGYGDIKDCVFYGLNANAIRMVQYDQMSGKTMTWERNFFYGPDTRGESCKAFKIRAAYDQDPVGATFIIRNNVVDLTGTAGTWSSDLSPAVEVATISGDYGMVPTIYLFNNTVVSDSYCQFAELHGAETLYCYNNVVYDVAVAVDNASSNHHFRNNVFYSCDTLITGSPGTDSENVTTDPHLFNVSMSHNLATDADLTSESSNCINVGYGTAGSGNIPSDDYLKNPRNDGYIDRGAFEYGVNPPTNLRIKSIQ